MSGKKYILSIDQSTQGTKGLLFDGEGLLCMRYDLPHRQIVDEKGWVEHDPEEIFQNTLKAARGVLEKAGVAPEDVAGVGISNQRETAVAWDRETGKAVYNAIVWQCARGARICERIEGAGHAAEIKRRTGLHLSPYFSAAKLAWILENVPEAAGLMRENKLCMGTVDSWLLFRLTEGRVFKTDFSNASRTQLMNIEKLSWDGDVCGWFGIAPSAMPEICDSDSLFASSTFGGLFETPVPIHGVLGDSHGALFGQGCLKPGMIKCTYGTGSSVMMNIGEKPVFSDKGVVTSLAWRMSGRAEYVLEGNINYTGAVMRWIVEDLGLLENAKQAAETARKANKEDTTYLVPAFSGLNAPYWDSNARAVLCGMTRTTGKNEIVKAAEECIAYQITDIVEVMRGAAGIAMDSLRVDGGPTKDGYLMQFQSDILQVPVLVPDTEELSGMGAAYAAGLALGVYHAPALFEQTKRTRFTPSMDGGERAQKYAGWKHAVEMILTK